MAKAYADAHGLELDGQSFQDLGVSAHKGKNLETGQLGAFLELVEEGIIPKGAYLLVENLDRISRQAARKAAGVLGDIVDAGVNVVTLTDGRVYTKELMDRDPFAFMMVVLGFVRANQESELKADRLRQAWANKRATAGEKKLTAGCPAWLKLNRDANLFEVIEGRGEVVSRIYEMAATGSGLQTIANTLNTDGVQPFGEAAYWHRSYIVKILDNPAAAGIYVPYVNERREDRKRVRVAQEPIPGYYPAVVAQDVYEKVRALRAGNRPAPKARSANLLAGLARCPHCGSSMTRINKGGRNTTAYFLCSKAHHKAGCERRHVRQDTVERAIIGNASFIVGTVPSADGSIDRDLDEAETAIEVTRGQVDNIVEAITRRPSPALSAKLRNLEDVLRELTRTRDELIEKAATTAGPLLESRLTELEQALTLYEPVKANALLRQMLDSIEVDYPSGQLRLNWRHRGSTSIGFAWPLEDVD
jgi:DNA invertase Pin-like site-specific DNA recombinase